MAAQRRGSSLEAPISSRRCVSPGKALPSKSAVSGERIGRWSSWSWVKTTGGKGLHVMVPLAPVQSCNVCYERSASIARDLVRLRPRTFTTAFGKAARAGKILLDYKRNHRAAVAVVAFSTRARPNGLVSVPLAWEELPTLAAPDTITVRNLREHLEQRGFDPWVDYFTCAQRLAKLPGPRKSRSSS